MRTSSIWRALACFALVLAVPACKAPSCGTPPTDPGFYNNMVRNRGDHWLDADLVTSVALPDGRSVWLFGDTTWGSRNADGTFAPGWSMTTNSAITQDGTCTTASGSSGGFVSPALNGDGNDHYWPASAYVANGRLWVSFNRIRVTGPGIFDLVRVRSEVVELSLPDLGVVSVQNYPDSARQWGQSAAVDGGWVYVYGLDQENLRLARAPVGSPTVLSYWTGGGWSGDPAAATVVVPSAQNGVVTRLPTGRWLAYSKNFYSSSTDGWVADSATGPFVALPQPMAPAPSWGNGDLAYMPSVHPQIGYESTGWLVYAVNHINLDTSTIGNGSFEGPVFSNFDAWSEGIKPANPIGSLDVATGGAGGTITAAGWAIDPDTTASIPVHVYVDNVGKAILDASQSRPDVGAAYPGYGDNHGYSVELFGFAAGGHTLCTYGINVLAGNANTVLGCRGVTVPAG